MKRKLFQSVKTIIICQECGKEIFNYSVTCAGYEFTMVKYYRNPKYHPPQPDGYREETKQLSRCLKHTKGRETIRHFDRNIILLKKKSCPVCGVKECNGCTKRTDLLDD